MSTLGANAAAVSGAGQAMTGIVRRHRAKGESVVVEVFGRGRPDLATYDPRQPFHLEQLRGRGSTITASTISSGFGSCCGAGGLGWG